MTDSDAESSLIEATTDPPRTVATERGEVAYAAYGDPDGAPVFFFHGTPGSRLLGALWDGAARERGVRLLAVDRPGYGRSDPWTGRTLADTADFAVPVLDDAGADRAGAVGFSGGGPHALALAATTDRVRRVGLVAGAVPRGEDPRAQRLLGTLASRTPRLLGTLLRVQRWVARRNPGSVVGQYTSGDAASVPDGVTELVGRDFVEALRSRNGVVTESRLFAGTWDLPLEAIDAPVELFHGTRDGNVPVEGARALAARLDADLTVEETDHLRTLLASREAILDRQAILDREAGRE